MAIKEVLAPGMIWVILKSLSNSKQMKAIREVDLKFFYDANQYNNCETLTLIGEISGLESDRFLENSSKKSFHYPVTSRCTITDRGHVVSIAYRLMHLQNIQGIQRNKASNLSYI